MLKNGIKPTKLFYLYATAYERCAKLVIMEIANLSIRNLFPGIGTSKKPEIRSRCPSFEFWKQENGIIRSRVYKTANF